MESAEEDETTSSESNTGGEESRPRLSIAGSVSQSRGTEEQGLQINLAISSGLARLYSMLTQADQSITFGLCDDSDSNDEDYQPSFLCRSVIILLMSQNS